MGSDIKDGSKDAGSQKAKRICLKYAFCLIIEANKGGK